MGLIVELVRELRGGKWEDNMFNRWYYRTEDAEPIAHPPPAPNVSAEWGWLFGRGGLLKESELFLGTPPHLDRNPVDSVEARAKVLPFDAFVASLVGEFEGGGGGGPGGGGGGLDECVRLWDACVRQGNLEYSRRMHNIFCDNCHSHVGRCLQLMGYAARPILFADRSMI